MRRVRSGWRRWVIVWSAIVAGGCADLFLTEPRLAPASMSIALSEDVAASGPLEDALQQADQIQVTLTPSDGGTQISETQSFSFDGTEARVAISVSLTSATQTFQVELTLSTLGAPLFVARGTVTMTEGSTTAFTPTLDPEVGDVTVTGPTTITALQDQVSYSGQAVFATGETVPGATVTFTSLDPHVLRPVQGGTFESVAEGTARLQVSAQAGATEVTSVKSIVSVTVAAAPASIEVTPTSLSVDVGASSGVSAVVRDRNGNALGRVVSWSVVDVGVATVSPATGASTAVTGVAQGSTTVTASHGGLSATAQVVVGVVLGTGDVQVTLTWDNDSDLDLWVTDPSGERIYFGNHTSQSGGRLDIDDTDGLGPENVFWPTGQAPAGLYIVEVDHYAGSTIANYSVRVLAQGQSKSYSGPIDVGATLEVVRFTLGQPLPAAAAMRPVERPPRVPKR